MSCCLSPDTSPVAVITGAGRRIGREIAVLLASQGVAVALHCHESVDDARTVAEEIQDMGGKACVLQADLRREVSVVDVIGHAAAQLGTVGILINNASTFEYDAVDTVTRDSWDAHMEVNLWAPLVLTQAFSAQIPPDMTGCVVNILDQRVWSLTPHFISYTVSKTGLWTLTQTLALALAPRIRVNAIGPGPALPSARQSEVQFSAQCAALPLQRGTTPVEIAEAVSFILSAPAMTGQMIALDGGQHLGWSFPTSSAQPDE